MTGVTRLPDVHVALAGGERSTLVDLAVEAERLGFGGVWVAEGPGRDAFSLLTEIALRTRRLALGTGIVNIYGRSPTVLAQAAASLAECAAGRAVHLGLGTASRILIEGAYGVPFERPLTRMRETLAIVRQALSGEPVRAQGAVFDVERLQLGIPGRERVRLFVAGLSRRMLRITGEEADGWLPIWPSRWAFQDVLAREVAGAAAGAGRPLPEVAAYVYTYVGEDTEQALTSLRRALAWYMVNAGPAYEHLFRRYGYGEVVDRVTAAWRAGDREGARASIPADVIRDLCLVGRTESIPAQLEGLRTLGIDHPVIRLPDDLGPGQAADMLRAIAGAREVEPRYRELPVIERTGAHHAWGVFGTCDQLGTVNRITPDVVAAAAREVREGEIVNLSLPLTEPGPLSPRRPNLAHTVDGNRSGRDDHLDSFYLQGSTQWDGLQHVRYREFGYYGGREEADLDAGALGVHRLAERGLVTRGVLVDVAGWRASRGEGIDAEARVPLPPETLDAVLQWEGVSTRRGDVLLVRTGWLTWYRSLDGNRRAALEGTLPEMASPGLAPGEETAAWLWDHGVAAVAADNPALEVVPTVREEGFLHRLLIPLLGMPIGELWDLEGLAEACRRRGRHTFLLTSAPLNLPGGVGTPANAYAVF
ncbi:MAG: LLM class flavin-dependent oxidoreductase [Candidatus Dormibacteraeota bacterium]|nr:LLM class flavin-dependent oxidoreductase [Candidatus Dormibacteraeota bacterium]MBO0759866.1 LLM class flavin-dependent oxidoreductase [Candidatus Dormibacteraeota bacterium]